MESVQLHQDHPTVIVVLGLTCFEQCESYRYTAVAGINHSTSHVGQCCTRYPSTVSDRKENLALARVRTEGT